MASGTLEQTLSTARTLISHLNETLSSINNSTPPSSSGKPINPLALSSTASALIKAQTTKLTLLSLNKPFTPDSISRILTTISASPLPAVVTAVQLCEPSKFSKFAQHELQSKVTRLLKAYENLLAEIPTSQADQDARITAAEARTTGSKEQKAALVGTGLVWEVCDEIVAFAEQGLVVSAAKKMTSHRSLYSDAYDEIDEWLVDGTTDEGIDTTLDKLNLGDGVSDSESNISLADKPTPETAAVAEWALSVLNHIALLFPPLIKRRIRRFPEINSKTSIDSLQMLDVDRLDQILQAGQYWTEQIDFIAEGLFENDGPVAIERVDELVTSAETVINAARLTWEGSEDEFFAWTIQWKTKLLEIKTAGRPLS